MRQFQAPALNVFSNKPQSKQLILKNLATKGNTLNSGMSREVEEEDNEDEDGDGEEEFAREKTREFKRSKSMSVFRKRTKIAMNFLAAFSKPSNQRRIEQCTSNKQIKPNMRLPLH
jgi:hypothetical protein